MAIETITVPKGNWMGVETLTIYTGEDAYKVMIRHMKECADRGGVVARERLIELGELEGDL